MVSKLSAMRCRSFAFAVLDLTAQDHSNSFYRKYTGFWSKESTLFAQDTTKDSEYTYYIQSISCGQWSYENEPYSPRVFILGVQLRVRQCFS